MERSEKDAYSDLTLAAVVDVFERCTSFTAIFVSCMCSVDDDFGRHSQTLPQFPKPICEEDAVSRATPGRHLRTDTDFLDELEPVGKNLVRNGEDVRRLLRRLWWGDHGGG